MPRNTITLGILLLILGGGTFGLTGFDTDSLTLLSPTWIGIPFVLLGLLAQHRKTWCGYAMFTAFILAALVFLSTLSSLVELVRLLGPSQVAQPMVVAEHAVMAALCGGFAFQVIRSYLDVYRHQETEPSL